MRVANFLQRPEPEFRIYTTKEEVIRESAECFTRAVLRAAEGKNLVTVALSGGSTPKAMHLLLSDPNHPYFSKIPWGRVHFFWGDERFVPPTDADSNFRMAKETLLDRVMARSTGTSEAAENSFLDAGNIHRVRTEGLSPEESAEAYERELRMFFRLTDSRQPPRFDLILLGLGPDAHTASLFPNAPLRRVLSGPQEGRWVVSFHVPHLNADRVTFTPALINAANHVVFMVEGRQKAEAVRRVFESDEPAESVPAKLIQPVNGTLTWIMDREAVSLLQERL
jgi:6-phosphogluconolactonase